MPLTNNVITSTHASLKMPFPQQLQYHYHTYYIQRFELKIFLFSFSIISFASSNTIFALRFPYFQLSLWYIDIILAQALAISRKRLWFIIMMLSANNDSMLSPPRLPTTSKLYWDIFRPLALAIHLTHMQEQRPAYKQTWGRLLKLYQLDFAADDIFTCLLSHIWYFHLFIISLHF